MRVDERVRKRMNGRETIVEEGWCGNNKRGSKMKQSEEEGTGINSDDKRG